MKPISGLLYFIIISALYPTSAFAQSGSCRDIIPPDGARRTIDLEQDTSLSIVDYSVARSAISQSKSDRFNVDVVGKGSGSSAKARAKASIIENTSYYNLTHDRYINYRMVEGDKNIIDAWRGCMKDRGGLSIELSSPDRRLIVASVSWIKPRLSNMDQTILKRDIFISNADIDQNTCGDAGAILDERGCTIIFSRRSRKDDSVVLISTEAGDETAILPPNYSISFKQYPFSSKTYSLKTRISFPAGGRDTIPVNYKIDMPREIIDRGFVFYSDQATLSVIDSTFMQRGNTGACDVSSGARVNPTSISGTILIWSNRAYPAFCEISPNVDVIVPVIDGEGSPSLD